MLAFRVAGKSLRREGTTARELIAAGRFCFAEVLACLGLEDQLLEDFVKELCKTKKGTEALSKYLFTKNKVMPRNNLEIVINARRHHGIPD